MIQVFQTSLMAFNELSWWVYAVSMKLIKPRVYHAALQCLLTILTMHAQQN